MPLAHCTPPLHKNQIISWANPPANFFKPSAAAAKHIMSRFRIIFVGALCLDVAFLVQAFYWLPIPNNPTINLFGIQRSHHRHQLTSHRPGSTTRCLARTNNDGSLDSPTVALLNRAVRLYGQANNLPTNKHLAVQLNTIILSTTRILQSNGELSGDQLELLEAVLDTLEVQIQSDQQKNSGLGNWGNGSTNTVDEQVEGWRALYRAAQLIEQAMVRQVPYEQVKSLIESYANVKASLERQERQQMKKQKKQTSSVWPKWNLFSSSKKGKNDNLSSSKTATTVSKSKQSRRVKGPFNPLKSATSSKPKFIPRPPKDLPPPTAKLSKVKQPRSAPLDLKRLQSELQVMETNMLAYLEAAKPAAERTAQMVQSLATAAAPVVRQGANLAWSALGSAWNVVSAAAVEAAQTALAEQKINLQGLSDMDNTTIAQLLLDPVDFVKQRLGDTSSPDREAWLSSGLSLESVRSQLQNFSETFTKTAALVSNTSVVQSEPQTFDSDSVVSRSATVTSKQQGSITTENIPSIGNSRKGPSMQQLAAEWKKQDQKKIMNTSKTHPPSLGSINQSSVSQEQKAKAIERPPAPSIPPPRPISAPPSTQEKQASSLNPSSPETASKAVTAGWQTNEVASTAAPPFAVNPRETSQSTDVSPKPTPPPVKSIFDNPSVRARNQLAQQLEEALLNEDAAASGRDPVQAFVDSLRRQNTPPSTSVASPPAKSVPAPPTSVSPARSPPTTARPSASANRMTNNPAVQKRNELAQQLEDVLLQDLDEAGSGNNVDPVEMFLQSLQTSSPKESMTGPSNSRASASADDSQNEMDAAARDRIEAFVQDLRQIRNVTIPDEKDREKLTEFKTEGKSGYESTLSSSFSEDSSTGRIAKDSGGLDQRLEALKANLGYPSASQDDSQIDEPGDFENSLESLRQKLSSALQTEVGSLLDLPVSQGGSRGSVSQSYLDGLSKGTTLPEKPSFDDLAKEWKKANKEESAGSSANAFSSRDTTEQASKDKFSRTPPRWTDLAREWKERNRDQTEDSPTIDFSSFTSTKTTTVTKAPENDYERLSREWTIRNRDDSR